MLNLLDPHTVGTATWVRFVDEATGESIDSRDLDVVVSAYSVSDTPARRYTVEVPGRDGALDLTEALGGVYFGNREVTIELNAAGITREQGRYIASHLRNTLDGKLVRCIASDDPAYFWLGRCQVDADKERMFPVLNVTITIDAEPYKHGITSSYEPWLWDLFSFVDGVITQQSDVILDNETKSVTLPKDPARGKPILWLNSSSGTVSARLSTDQTWHLLRSGKNTLPDIRMRAESEVVLQLRGTGSVGVEYRIGSL